MILTGPEIERQVAAERITLDPFVSEHVNPNSYDYRLGGMLRDVAADPNNSGAGFRAVAGPLRGIPEGGLVLRPGKLYLASTLERIGSRHFVTSLIGKSSLGRLGLFLQISANIGHQGVAHRWTLELHCCHPIRVYPGMIIGQISFWTTLGHPFPYNGYYASFNTPTPSLGAT